MLQSMASPVDSRALLQVAIKARYYGLSSLVCERRLHVDAPFFAIASCVCQLTLSQDAERDELVHELEVDIDHDHDGEGVSRWAAMTSFWDLISYQVSMQKPADKGRAFYYMIRSDLELVVGRIFCTLRLVVAVQCNAHSMPDMLV